MTEKEKCEFKYNTVEESYRPWTEKTEVHEVPSYRTKNERKRALIRQLKEQGYDELKVHNESDLTENLRQQLQRLNDFVFSEEEWKRFFSEYIADPNDSIIDRTRKFQEDDTYALITDSGRTKNIRLIDRKELYENQLQILDFQTENTEALIILINGIPVVCIELCRQGTELKEAFNHITEYPYEQFESRLFEYIQIYVISNGKKTKYYSNTTRLSHLRELKESGRRKSKKTSNTFEFTSFWSDAKNQRIEKLEDFAATFFSKHTIINILAMYCVLTSEDILLVMRPYQIAAAERILKRIEISTNNKKVGTIQAGGYIWHTTGSGKTLTSFKAAQLAVKLPDIKKVLFVVDRKDLDYQTMKEYDRFQKGAANSNTSTKILKQQLEDPSVQIIITTIQKLDRFIVKNRGHAVYKEHIVFIFDECHRSQFGDMHQRITDTFKNYHLFGFTGTPIFEENALKSRKKLRTAAEQPETTEQIFGEMLHSYTILNAIKDENVLPFRIDYLESAGTENDDPKRIESTVRYLLEHFDQKTRRNDSAYRFSSLLNVEEIAVARRPEHPDEKRQEVYLKGFNSILAVSSVKLAKMYYSEIMRQLRKQPGRRLNVALIYSSSTEEDVQTGLLGEENSEDTSDLDEDSREFLKKAIVDYNRIFQTHFDVKGELFQNYYKDVSLRMKNREIDLLIVVNMFLTGFDATTLNTLWVDKNLRQHGLIQAFSRTNRILNSVKTYGNIVCFRNLEKETDEALANFGVKKEKAKDIVLLRKYEDYYYGYQKEKEHYTGYSQLLEEMLSKFPVGREIPEEKQKEFLQLFGNILKLRNILTSFDEFLGHEGIAEQDFQSYQSRYIDCYHQYSSRKEKVQGETEEDVVFELDLIRQIEVNMDYILMLIEKYHSGGSKDQKLLDSIHSSVNASLDLREKRDLIEKYLNSRESGEELEWNEYIEREKQLYVYLLINKNHLKPKETQEFMNRAFRDGEMKTTGTDIDKLMPPISRFGGNKRDEKKSGIVRKLTEFFDRFLGLNE